MDVLHENYALNRIKATRPSSEIPKGSPSLRQCVGTNRLWGAFLGKALFDDLGGSVPLDCLVDIAILARAILVLDDHVDDEYLDAGRDGRWYRDWTLGLEDELRAIFEHLGEDFDDHARLRSRSQEEVGHRTRGSSSLDVFRSSIEKCLIFFNPYRLKVARAMEIHESRLRFLEVFFFACQLLDDFQDLSEDLQKKTNQNIFHRGLSHIEQRRVNMTRLNWVGSLLLQVSANLDRSDVRSGALNSPTMSAFLSAAHEYLAEMLRLAGLQDSGRRESETLIRFEAWNFEPIEVAGLQLFPAELEKFVRPEFMQTYSRGFRKLSAI